MIGAFIVLGILMVLSHVTAARMRRAGEPECEARFMDGYGGGLGLAVLVLAGVLVLGWVL